MAELHPGQRIGGRYELQHPLGQGAMGTTWAALDIQTSQPVAVKALSLQALSDWKALELFEREAKVLAQLNHSSIPRYIDYLREESEGSPSFFVLVQELIEGESLAQRMAGGWRPSPEQARRLARELLGALVYLHGLTPPVIHRDIKPQNVLLRANGEAALVDFGAVKERLRGEGSFASTVVGTYGYMAPEQFRGQAAPSSDLYALGATLVAVLSGQQPEALPHRRLKLDFRAVVQVEERLAAWLDQMLEPAPEDRFPSAAAALAALEALERPIARSSTPSPEVFLPPSAPLAFPAPPLGSRIELDERDGEAVVTLPAAGLRGLTGQRVFMMFFAGFWLSFVTVWTGGAAMGSLLFAAFSIPFWLAGFWMVFNIFRGLVAGERLRLSQHQWIIERRLLGGTWKTDRGAVADIDHVDIGRASNAMGQNQRQRGISSECVKISSGVHNYELGEHLGDAERRWLLARVQAQVELSRQARQLPANNVRAAGRAAQVEHTASSRR